MLGYSDDGDECARDATPNGVGCITRCRQLLGDRRAIRLWCIRDNLAHPDAQRDTRVRRSVRNSSPTRSASSASARRSRRALSRPMPTREASSRPIPTSRTRRESQASRPSTHLVRSPAKHLAKHGSLRRAVSTMPILSWSSFRRAPESFCAPTCPPSTRRSAISSRSRCWSIREVPRLGLRR